MKKILFIITLSVGINLSCSFAQVTLIPKIGVALSQQSHVYTDPYFKEAKVKNMSGLVEGIGINIPFSNRFISIKTELLYIQKGYKWESGDSKTNWQVNYIELPVLLNAEKNYKILRGYIYAGPSLSYGLAGKIISYVEPSSSPASASKLAFNKGTNDYSMAGTLYLKDIANRMDLGLQLGGGMGIAMGPGAILLDVRYGLGITGLYKKDLQGFEKEFFNRSAKNKVWALTLGYAIPLVVKGKN